VAVSVNVELGPEVAAVDPGRVWQALRRKNKSSRIIFLAGFMG
jgi:hypothetical protein